MRGKIVTTPHAAVLLADVGGTTVRFALLIGGIVGPIEHVLAQDYACFNDALSDFLARHGEGAAISDAQLAVAGVVDGERCALTNSSWIIDGAELRAMFGFARVHLVNDFEAIAWSLPHLLGADLYALGGGRPVAAGAPVAVLGPGTGLGVAGLVPPATTKSSSPAKAATAHCRRARRASIWSSSIYVSSSGTYRPSEHCRAPAWKISIGRLRQSTA